MNGMMENGLIPTIHLPTRITHHSNSVIDCIYIKGHNNYTFHSRVIVSDISDHCPILALTGKSQIQMPSQDTLTRPPINDHILNCINNDLCTTNFHPVETLPLDDATQYLISATSSVIDKHAPLRKKKSRNKTPRQPWMTQALLKSSRTKLQLYSKCHDLPHSNPKYEKFVSYRNLYNQLVRKAKQEYFHNSIELNKNNSRKCWEIVNGLLGKKRKNNYVSKLCIENRVVQDPIKIAERFAQYFNSVGKEQAESILTDQLPTDPARVSSFTNRSLYLKPVSESEITAIISRLKPKISAGYDSISPKVLKQISLCLISPITKLINRCMADGYFPSPLKIARVIPIHKGKETCNVSNYRPISLLTSLSKIYESALHSRITKFLTQNNLLSEFQFGFKAHHSTADAIILFTSEALEAFERKQNTLAVFCDLSKAFDTIKHEILLSKLYKYGIRGKSYDVLKSYLTDRTLYVQNGQSQSHALKSHNYGVPQGSILGPLLFNIYTNDFKTCLKFSSHIQYADDTTIYLSSDNINDIVHKMNEDLNNISIWFKRNSLLLNPSKTHSMMFSPTKLLNEQIDLKIDGEKINPVETLKFLGVHLDCQLKWNFHTTNVAKRKSAGLYALRSLKYTLPTHTLLSLYYALIHPHLTYANIVWGNTLQKSLHPIEIAQKKALRAITRSPYNCTSQPLFKDLNILRVCDIHQTSLLHFMFKYHNGIIPSALTTLFNTHSEIHSLNTRNRSDFVIKRYHNVTVHRSFLLQGPKYWASLKAPLKQILKFHLFKRQLKDHIISDY